MTAMKHPDNAATSYKLRLQTVPVAVGQPTTSTEKRSKIPGRSAWKVWTPEALLRAAFSSPSAALRQVASEIDGASASQVLNARMLVADIILHEQENGLSQERQQATNLALDPADTPRRFWILNLMFDETELPLNLDREGTGSRSFLASHSQLSIACEGFVKEFDFIRLPQALPRKTASSCMWGALGLHPRGLWPGNLLLQAEHVCFVVTCDPAAANLKLLKHLHAQLPQKRLLLPMLCTQHRNGNIVERATQLLGILPGSYCLAKCSSKGKFVKDWKEAVQRQLEQDLVIVDAVPPGLRGEWSEAERQASLTSCPRTGAARGPAES